MRSEELDAARACIQNAISHLLKDEQARPTGTLDPLAANKAQAQIIKLNRKARNLLSAAEDWINQAAYLARKDV